MIALQYGTKVLVNGQEVTILTSNKDFMTNKVSYTIKETGDRVDSSEVEEIMEIVDNPAKQKFAQGLIDLEEDKELERLASEETEEETPSKNKKFTRSK